MFSKKSEKRSYNPLLTLFVGAAAVLQYAKLRAEKVERTRQWFDEFIEQFVVPPTGIAHDFATQSMPKLESLAYLYNAGVVDRYSIIDRLYRGDFAQHADELVGFIETHELAFRRNYPNLCQMFGLTYKQLKKRQDFINKSISERDKPRKAKKAEPFGVHSKHEKRQIMNQAQALQNAESLGSDEAGEVPFHPNPKLYQEFETLFGEKEDRLD